MKQPNNPNNKPLLILAVEAISHFLDRYSTAIGCGIVISAVGVMIGVTIADIQYGKPIREWQKEREAARATNNVNKSINKQKTVDDQFYRQP